ncbi:WD40-repeat-containing domain protein [Lipomyces japonicus]|uniref:WD40-repeat-containing domain protein n=1 Tax=Lipomyces japonicus TaxID=56871 RepID=UPI0034CF5136
MDVSVADQFINLFTVQPARRLVSSATGTVLPIPNPEGAYLGNSGELGYVEDQAYQLKSRRKYPRTIGDRLFRRETSAIRYPSSLFTKSFIPNYTSKHVLRFHARTYSGQFSQDGSFFFTASQDFKVRLYDTTQAFPWRLYKTVRADMARWTVTDASLSNDNRFLAYSSITPVVHLASTSPDDGGQVALDFSESNYNRGLHRSYGIWSIRFSSDGREIVAGASDSCMYVYDIERQKVVLQLEGHTDDVNAVCFGDETGNILYSGSDDSLIKVWDRRSMRSKQEAGVLLGHIEGITYIDSKKDGRYLLSNSKDQTMKLWDIRKLVTADDFRDLDHRQFGTHFDYRYQAFPLPVGKVYANDCSVMTFTGHEVLRTLIRCHFSPTTVTGSQYVYSGSADGHVYVWSMDGTIRSTIDVSTPSPNGGGGGNGGQRYRRRHDYDNVSCVRDVSWHPYLPIMASSAWSGYSNEEGTVMLHEWRDRNSGRSSSLLSDDDNDDSNDSDDIDDNDSDEFLDDQDDIF